MRALQNACFQLKQNLRHMCADKLCACVWLCAIYALLVLNTMLARGAAQRVRARKAYYSGRLVNVYRNNAVRARGVQHTRAPTHGII